MSIFSFSHVNKTKYSTFNMSHDVKLSMEMGQLIPIVCEEVLPGDTFKLSSEYLIRLAPMIAPIMHRVDVRTETFFVPNRILCKDWEKVMYPSQSPNQPADAPGAVNPSLPVFDPHSIFSQPDAQYLYSWSQEIESSSGQLQRDVMWNAQCSLADYLGIPTENISPSTAPQTYISCLPFLAYQKIYNDYYRDQNLMPDLSDYADANGRGFLGNTNNLFDLSGDLSAAWAAGSTQGQGLNTFENLFALRYRCWEKDYFTSALPWRQAGDPVVAPLMYDSSKRTYLRNNSGSLLSDGRVLGSSTTGVLRTLNQEIQGDSIVNTSFNAVNVDVTANTGLSIHDLQTASWLQRFLENVALGGSRAIEQIKAHFGVQVPDYRLQRAEYLGGTRTPMTVGEVLQTSETVEDQPLGQPGGHASAIGSSHGITKKFVEHGWVITLLSVVPRTSYQQGLPRKFTRFNRLDFAWPEFAMLGEQEVYNRELYLGGFNESGWDNNGVFGYQQRYAEYKYIPSTVHGDFRTNLDFWHLGRIFDGVAEPQTQPKLNRNFVECRPTFREFSVNSEYNHLWVMIHNKIKANRPLPQISNSSLA